MNLFSLIADEVVITFHIAICSDPELPV